MRRWLTTILALPAAAAAQDTPPAAGPRSAQGDIAVTIYNNDLALIQDVRQMALPGGVSRQEFPDVVDGIRPATVRLSAAGTTIVEQNYDYDLLSPEALMAKAVGQTLTIVRTNPATGAETRERATILANNDGVVMRIGDRIEVLRDDGLPVRVVFDSLPAALRARPTLSVTLDTQSGGTRPVTLSYLAGGFGWSADYVALFDEAKATIDVQGWVTLRNGNDVALVNADTMLVAGSPGQDGGPRRTGIARGTRAGTETSGRGQLGDFYLYPLGHRTTIAANQQKQVSFLSVAAVPARKGYEFRNGWLNSQDDAQSANSVLAFSSSRDGGLGDALPAGITLSYLAGGFDWQADYVVSMRADGRSADVFAWVTLASSDVTSFAKAKAQVVAGKPNREETPPFGRYDGGGLRLRCWPTQVNYGRSPPPPPPPPMAMTEGAQDIVVTGQRAAAPRMAVQEDLGDLKLYRIPFATDVASQAQKQVALLAKPAVPLATIYVSEFYGGTEVEVRPVLRGRNRVADGLGLALPAGRVAVFRQAGGRRLLVGTSFTDDKAIGEDVEFKLDPTPNVTATIVDAAPDAKTRRHVLTVTNANPFAIRYEAKFPPGNAMTDRRLIRRDGRPVWATTVPANAVATFAFIRRED